jgi:hypothetical protein
MMRAWKTLGWQGVLAAALAGAPVNAEEKDGPKDPPKEPAAPASKPADKDRDELLKEIQNKLRSLGQQIEEIDSSLKNRIESLSESIDRRNTQNELRTQKMLRDIQQLQTDMGSAGTALGEVRQDLKSILSKEMAGLRSDIESLRKRFYPEPGPVPQAQQAPTGRVQLINAYADPMTVILNDRAYELLPNETRTVTVPAGAFTYQVLRVHADLQPRNLAANQTYTITVHPR